MIESIILLLLLFFKHCFSSQNEFTFRICEELPVKHLIGSLQQNGNSFNRFQYSYKMISRKSQILELFEISENEGDLRTKIKIDRDILCSRKSLCCTSITQPTECEINFKVVLQNRKSGHASKYFRIQVIIEDINDNFPKFLRNSEDIEISESAALGSYKNLPVATDEDVGKNSIYKYSLEKEISVFHLKTVTMSDTLYPRLELIDHLDRELVSEYQLILCAHDNGKPSKKGCITLNIHILDANDNPPVINLRSLIIRITQSVNPGKIIGSIKATDKDTGINAVLKYQISGLIPSIRKTFDIDSSSGEIKILQRLNYELIGKSQNQILLPIEVVDSGNTPLTATGTVTIHIQETNNESPTITVTYLPDNNPHKPFIQENRPPGQLVAFVHVIDTDQNENGQVDCFIKGSSKFRLIMEPEQRELQEREFKIETAQPIDREEQANIEIMIVCKDKGSPPRSSNKIVNIRITDENDNYPVFFPNPVLVKISENLPINSLVVRLNVTDADENTPGPLAVTCQFESNDNEFLQLDSDECTLYTRQLLDREMIEKINGHIIATDKGTPPKKTTAQVIVEIIDQNDNKPMFNKKLYEFHVKENQDPMIIAKITAQDADENLNGQITYQLSFHDNAAHVAFGIDSVVGNLHTKIRLDREKRTDYEFEVIAMDNGPIKLASSANVRVIVDDVNDNSPKFIYPSQENQSHTYSILNVKNTPLIKVTASDLDEGVNKEIIYEIVDGNRNGLFQLNPTSGQLYLARDLELNDAGTYIVTIETRDNGDPPLKSTGVLRLTFDSQSNRIPLYNKRNDVDPNRAGSEMQNSFVIGRNIILVICVIFVALLSVLVFLVMVYFLKKKQVLNTEMVIETVDEMGAKCDSMLLSSINQDHINITNNNLWHQCSNTYTSLPISSLTRQNEKYSTFPQTLPVNPGDETNNYYQRLMKNPETLPTSKISELDERNFRELGADSSLCFSNNVKNCGLKSVSNSLLVSTAGSLSIKNRNTSSFAENTGQISSSNVVATNPILSSSFV